MKEGKFMGKGYEEFMQKAHGALILEREDDIIVELRATREYLEQKIDESIAETNARFDGIEKRMDSLEAKLDVIIEMLKK